ncbi:glycoside hydrolase family 2 protein [Allorhizobium undicola]|uniref:glycoside hydrolase family 2 protein n=1 Tax=Allorhizobium undicola TaxID=78527 RepID=UPI003D32B4D0
MTLFLDADIRPLEAGWTLLLTEAGAHESPDTIHRAAARLAAPVPGTVAEALTKAGLFDPHHPVPLEGKDAWYFRSLKGEQPGPAVLRFEGLATITEIWLNGKLELTIESMFEAHDLSLELTGEDELALCFRALAPHLSKRGPRARWRPQMMDSQGLRLVRTTLLGHMPGWCPSIHAIGPWRPISLIRPAAHSIENLRLTADLDEDGTGLLDVAFTYKGPAQDLTLSVAGESVTLTADDAGHYAPRLTIPAVKPWWPATHGEPALHDVSLGLDGTRHSLGLTGFRRIRLDRGDDGKDFALIVNGVKIFCRGAVWTSANITRLPGSTEDYAPWLMMAREAGMNMLRIGGTMAYESPDFFRLCDRLGLLVWQDFQFANYDYPVADETFATHVHNEVTGLLSSLQGSPSLALLCGGSESEQQAAMLGLPPAAGKTPLSQSILPALSASLRPDVPYIGNSPSGGPLPFTVNEGVSHYYGVGAYCRPLTDARLSGLRFAAECLAFAHVPQQMTLDRHLAVPPVHDPRWKARVPRDRAASWDFEDIRDHYLAELYDVDPARLRRQDPARYLHLSRAVSGEVLEACFAEWRRPDSCCNGALVWTFQDLLPGPGWGLIDATGLPKPVWYAARRAFQPVRVSLTDEGLNGLDVHVVNDGPEDTALTLTLACLREGRTPVLSGKTALRLAPRTGQSLHATDVFGAFFDTTYAYRFGPPAHDVTVATLWTEGGDMLSQAFHFPQGRATATAPAQVMTKLVEGPQGWYLQLETDRLQQSLHICLENGRPEDDFFHLAPLTPRRIRLTGTTGRPKGTVEAPGLSPISF